MPIIVLRTCFGRLCHCKMTAARSLSAETVPDSVPLSVESAVFPPEFSKVRVPPRPLAIQSSIVIVVIIGNSQVAMLRYVALGSPLPWLTAPYSRRTARRRRPIKVGIGHLPVVAWATSRAMAEPSRRNMARMLGR